MKKNFLFGLIGAGALMLSAGVGFAAWTITGGNSSTDGNLSLKADATVTDSHINIDSKKSGWTGDYSIEFKPVIDKTKTYEYNWLSASDALEQENLTATYHLVGTAAKNASLTLTATITETTNVYSGLVTKGLVANPTLSVSKTTDVTANENGSFSQDITVTFAWGNHFKLNNAASAVNPYEFYNSQAYSDSLASDASTNISALKDLDNCTFKLSLSLAAK